MNEDFYNLKKMAGSSTVRYYNFIRGWNDNGGHRKGLIEKQHPELWKTPLKAFSLSYIFKFIFNLKLSSTELKVALVIIGHTWNFFKTSEIISRDQFINGKFDVNTDQCLVGPAGISPSSLAKSIDSLVEKGIIRRITIAHPSGPKPLYTANPVIGGELIYDTNPVERKWIHSNYPESAKWAIELIQGPLSPVDFRVEMDECHLFNELMNRLLHIELLPLLLNDIKEICPNLLSKRESWKKKIMESIEPSGGGSNAYTLRDKSLPGLLPEAIDEINQSERDWLDSEQVKELIENLHQIRVQVDRPLAASPSQCEAELQVHLLYLRWGDTLLALSIDAWERFEYLIKNYGELFDPFGKSIIEKYNLMKIERAKIPWIKKSADTFYKTKKMPVPKGNTDITFIPKELMNNSANTKEINQ